MIYLKNLELLAPAGDIECLETAFRFGADAVYLGGPILQLRASNVAFTMEKLENAIKIAHSLNKKVYLTMNSFAKNTEIELVKEYSRKVYELGIDAVIISDIGLLSTVHEEVPQLEIHVSTQANCQNYAAANTYYKLGAKRIVLGREMTIEEIKTLRKNTPKDLEIEAFVHGAMCMSYSGRCFISQYLTNRSANRGECTQPCRWKYHLVEQTRPNEFFPIEEDGKVTTILSSRDLNCISFIDELINAGVTSFKIEGRMKSPYYVATVVNAYRHRLDGDISLDVLQHELNCASHRPYSSGFYYGELEKYVPDLDTPYEQECIFVAVVKDYKDGFALIEQRNRFAKGDLLEILSPNSIGKSFNAEKLINMDNIEVDVAPHPQEMLWVNCPHHVESGDILRLVK